MSWGGAGKGGVGPGREGKGGRVSGGTVRNWALQVSAGLSGAGRTQAQYWVAVTDAPCASCMPLPAGHNDRYLIFDTLVNKYDTNTALQLTLIFSLLLSFATGWDEWSGYIRSRERSSRRFKTVVCMEKITYLWIISSNFFYRVTVVKGD